MQAVRTDAKNRIQLHGQRFLGRAFPWCTALRQLRPPVNTPVTDVIMALLRYRTTRSFCWTKTSLSPRWPADPDTTPAGSDVAFVWADVQLTFVVPWGGVGRGLEGCKGGTESHVPLGEHWRGGGWRDRHNETHTGSHQAPRIWRGGPPLEQKATQWPWRVDTEAHAVKCSFQLLVFMNISRSVQGILTSICNLKSMPVRQLMGKTSASLKRLPTFWLHLVFKSYAAAAELWLGQHERFNEVNCWGFNRRCDWVLRISSKNKEEKCQNLTGWIPV